MRRRWHLSNLRRLNGNMLLWGVTQTQREMGKILDGGGGWNGAHDLESLNFAR